MDDGLEIMKGNGLKGSSEQDVCQMHIQPPPPLACSHIASLSFSETSPRE
jgi:hypothetical protein